MTREPSSSTDDGDTWKGAVRFILILALGGIALFELVMLANANTGNERWSLLRGVALASVGVALLLPRVFRLSRLTRNALAVLAWLLLAFVTFSFFRG